MCRAAYDAAQNCEENQGGCTDPCTGGVQPRFISLTNGLLLSSFKKGELGGSLHVVVGRASSEVDYDGYFM